MSALRFLEERGLLTAEGKRELAAPDEEIALLDVHVKAAARAFLDESYEPYLSSQEGYGQPPSVQILETAWESYSRRYDLSKRPRPNAYQQLLLDFASDLDADSLLRSLNRVGDLPSRLRGALAEVPAADRSLVEATLAARADPVTLAATWPDPGALLHGLRYLDIRSHALPRLRAASLLAERLDVSGCGGAHLAALAHAVNLGASSEAEAAWSALRESEQSMLADAINLLFTHGEELHLALCAMRTVGNAQSLVLIDRSTGDPREGTTQYSDGSTEPSWEPVRREARESISRRVKVRS